MGFGCCGIGVDQVRNFLTREERIALLKEYSDGLEKEVQGIRERIKELEEKSSFLLPFFISFFLLSLSFLRISSLFFLFPEILSLGNS